MLLWATVDEMPFVKFRVTKIKVNSNLKYKIYNKHSAITGN